MWTREFFGEEFYTEEEEYQNKVLNELKTSQQ